jgi:hypothetical protein
LISKECSKVTFISGLLRFGNLNGEIGTKGRERVEMLPDKYNLYFWNITIIIL